MSFSFWTVLDESMATRQNSYKVLCRCICGERRLVSRKYLKNGKSKSCGCNGIYPGLRVDKYIVVRVSGADKYIKCECGLVKKTRFVKGRPRQKYCANCDERPKNKVHGEATEKPKEYRAWKAMRYRCYNSKSRAFKYYGGRGIKVCSRWESYENFLNDMGRCPYENYSLDRINNDGDYEPENCRWTDWKTQANNRRSAKCLNQPS